MNSSNMRLFLVFTLLFIAEAALAMDAADCVKVLAKDYYADARYRHLESDFLKTIDSQSYQELKKDGGISAIVEGVPLGANYSEFNTTRNSYLEKQHYSHSEDEARKIIRTVTSDRAYVAYEACLRSADTGAALRVWASKETMDSIELRVLYRNPPSTPNILLTGTVEGGTVTGAPEGSLWTEEQKKWGVNQEKLFKIKRTAGTSETTINVTPEDGSPPIAMSFQRADGIVTLKYDGALDVLRKSGVVGTAVNTPNNDNNKGGCPNSTGHEGKYCRSRTDFSIQTTPPKFLRNVVPHCENNGCGWLRMGAVTPNAGSDAASYSAYAENWGPVARLHLSADEYEHLSPSTCGPQNIVPVIYGIAAVFSVSKECLPLAHLEWKKLPSGEQGIVAFNASGNTNLTKVGDSIDTGTTITTAYRLGR